MSRFARDAAIAVLALVHLVVAVCTHPLVLLLLVLLVVYVLVRYGPRRPSGRRSVLAWKARVICGRRPGPGFARHLELGHHLGVRPAKRHAARLRPSLPHFSDPHDFAIRLGRAHWGRLLWAGLQEIVLVLAPPRSLKSQWLAGAVIDHNGPVVATTTREDMVTVTAALRARRGQVWLWNPQRVAGVSSNITWDPVAGCEDPSTAYRRAGALVAAGPKTHDVRGGGFWAEAAVRVLRCYLHAAALGGASMSDVAAWAADASNTTAHQILTRQAHTSPVATRWAAELDQVLSGPEETRGAVLLTLAQVLAFMADPRVAAVTTSGDGAGFDPAQFLASNGTLYLVAADTPHGSVAPLFAALVTELHYVARQVANSRPGGRLDPPLLMALDEAANICPVPLDRWVGDAAGCGIQLVAVFQSRAQLYTRWGKDAAGIIWDATTTKLIFGGLSDPMLLKDVAALAGKVDVRVRTVDRDHEGKRRHSWSIKTIDVLPDHHVRALPAGRALVLHRTCAPTIVKIHPAHRRRDVRVTATHPSPFTPATTTIPVPVADPWQESAGPPALPALPGNTGAAADDTGGGRQGGGRVWPYSRYDPPDLPEPSDLPGWLTAGGDDPQHGN